MATAAIPERIPLLHSRCTRFYYIGKRGADLGTEANPGRITA